MRQSEGNRTEKRLSAARLAQDVFRDGGLSGTIECLATAMVAWPARIRSSLLLKTASLRSRGHNSSRGRSSFALCLLLLQYNGEHGPRQRCGLREPAALPETCPAPSSADQINALARK